MITRRKHSYRRRRKKGGNRTVSKFIVLLIVLVLIPIAYGLFLYCQEKFCSGMIADQMIENKQLQQIPDHLEVPVSLIPRQEQLIHHQGYIASYNKNWKISNWVGYELTREEVKGKVKRSNRFMVDPLVKGGTAINHDYLRSGYDKGHMAPAADMKWSREAMRESFYFSNMCPQHPQLNRVGWRYLEEQIREWAVADSAIIVVTGPIVGNNPRTIGRNKVVVPDKFFKVVLSPYVSPMRAIAFLYENKKSTLSPDRYVVTVDSIETLTGLDFFAPLPDKFEATVESHSDFNLWPH